MNSNKRSSDAAEFGERASAAKRVRSQGHDPVSIDLGMTQQPLIDDEGASVVLPMVVDYTGARRAIESVVSVRMSALQLRVDTPSSTTAENSTTSTATFQDVMRSLCVEANEDVVHHIDTVCDALASTLYHVANDDVASATQDGVNQLIEVLLCLPNVDDLQLRLQRMPSDQQLHEHKQHVDVAYTASMNATGNVLMKDDAVRSAIAVLTAACEAHIQRLEWFQSEAAELRKRKRHVHTTLTALGERLKTQLDQATRGVESTESKLRDAAQLKEERNTAMVLRIKACCDQYVAAGENPLFANIDAHQSVLESTDREVVALRQARQGSQRSFLACRQEVLQVNTRLAFFQQIRVLFNKVRGHREQMLVSTDEQFRSARISSEQLFTAELQRLIPQLCTVLRRFYHFHIQRQVRANDDRAKQEEMYAAHKEFYVDEVDAVCDDFKRRIHQYTGVIARSTQLMRETAERQCTLWKGKRDILPPTVVTTVVREYRELYHGLSGGAKDMMRDCVRLLEGIDVDASLRVEAASTPIAIPLLQNATTNRETGFTAISPATSPTMHGFTQSQSTSPPLVDLTNEDDMDDLSTRIDFDTSSTRITPLVKTEQSIVNVTSTSKPAAAESTPAYAVGDVLYSAMNADDEDGEGITHGIVQGVMMADGWKYKMLYDSGDVYVVDEHLLFTDDQVRAVRVQANNDEIPGGSKCVVM